MATTDNRTRRYLASTSAKRGYDGQVFLPRQILNDPTFVRRLSYKFSGPSLEWRSNLSASIAQAPPEVAFFLDTNIWDKNLEDALWLALLSRPDSVHVIPSVRLELQGWIARNPSYIGSRAILEHHPQLMIDDVPVADSNEFTAYAHYIYLLRSRRSIALLYRMKFREENGRDPDPDELMVGLQRAFGERGLLLAHKDGRPVAPDKWATDESLAYLAAEHALRTGRPTVILTKDQDVLEQFYKTWWFLDTHYRAMLIAKSYSDNRFRYPLHPLPEIEDIPQVFDRRNGFLVELGPGRMNDFLPAAFTFVSAECWLIRKEMTRIIFGGETEMHHLLKIKGSTGGLVSDRLEGRNLHPWLAPLPIAERLRDSAAVAYDRAVEVPGTRARVGMFDLSHAINTRERFHRVAPDPRPLSEAGLWTPAQSSGRSEMGLVTSRRSPRRSEMGLWKPPSRAR